MRTWYFPVLLVLLVGACDSTEVTPEEWIEPEEALPDIRQHVDAFLAEAEAHGATDSLFFPANLRIEVSDTLVRDGRELCGYGGFTPADQEPIIYIATNKGCWDRSDYDREIVIFHELGHALLKRGHRDDFLPNGLRASIMYSGNILGLYSETRSVPRAHYMDELFNADTELPGWAFQPAPPSRPVAGAGGNR